MGSPFDSATLRPVTMCGRNLPYAAHICAFFDSEDQEYDCLAPFFAEGLAQGEQVVSIRDAGRVNEHLERLRPRIPQPLEPAIASNQLRVVASEETYLKEGCFEAERMYSMLEDMLQGVRASGFTRMRGCGAMSWALREMPGTGELMEYEARVNTLTNDHDCTLMCVYDINKFSGRAVLDVLATHPMVVMGDRIYENQYYVEPAEYLQALLRRGSTPLARSDAPLD